MRKYLATWMELKNGRRAVTALEYAILGSLIAVVVIAAETLLGSNLSAQFNMVATSI